MELTFKAIESMTEEQAREALEAIRWPDGPVCPRCGHNQAYKLKPRATSKRPVRAGVWKCKLCYRQFTVTVGTVFDGSRIPLKDWLMATYLVCSSKKGMSAHQLHRTLKVSYNTAWFMAHRIRLAMTQEPLTNLMSGEVELDATYIGGKSKYRHAEKRELAPLVNLLSIILPLIRSK